MPRPLINPPKTYYSWRKLVLIRDEYTCQFCGSIEKLEVHHIKNYRDYPELRYVVNNGVTLCKKCHINKTDYGNKKRKKYGRIYPSI